MLNKIFVLDSSVLIHSPEALFNFADNTIILDIAVIDDLDNIKSLREPSGYAARDVFRTLDKYDIKELTNGGVVINESMGILKIYNSEKQQEVPNIVRVNSDNALISTSLAMQRMYPDNSVILVTLDTALMVRAMSYGVKAEKYRAESVNNINYTGVAYGADDELLVNQFRIVDGVVSMNNAGEEVNIEVRGNCFGIKPKNPEQICAMFALLEPKIFMVTLAGSAGVGKSLLALATGLKQVDKGIYDKVIYIKPIIPVSGRDLGALPGDKNEKLSQWFGPLKDNLSQLHDGKDFDNDLNNMIDDGILEMECLAYIQGRSLVKSFIIADEASNISPRECRMIAERCGKDSKLVVMGDVSQIENPYLDERSCGLSYAIHGSADKEQCAIITMKKVERSELANMASEIFGKK